MSERSSFSRRMMLAAVPAMAAIPAPSLAVPARSTDDELIRLGAEFTAARKYVANAVGPDEDYPEDFVLTDDLIAAQMCDVPAKTSEGLKIKARALFVALGLPDDESPQNWDEYLIAHGGVADGLTFSIIADILAMENLHG